MKKVILCLILIISTLSPYVSANNELTHEDMIRLYGDSYADSFLGTVVEANAKLAVNEAENRELLDTWISNNMDYLKGRARSYVDSMQGAPEGANFVEKMLYGYGGLFKEVGIGAYTLAETGWDMLKNLFTLNEENPRDYEVYYGSCFVFSPPTTQGGSYSFSYNNNCDYLLYRAESNEFITDLRMSFGYTGSQYYETLRIRTNVSIDWKYYYQINDPFQPSPFIDPPRYSDMTLIYSLLNRFNWDNDVTQGPVLRQFKLVYKQSLIALNDERPIIINHIVNNNVVPKPINLPILKPQATCPDGQRVIVPDGQGGYLDGNGQPTDVSQCTVVWQQPVIERDDTGALQIDNGSGPQELESGDSGEGGLGSIAAIISALADAVKSLAGFVTDLLDGLLGLFVPDDLDFVSDEINRITDELISKISVVEDIKTMLTSMFVPTDVNPLSNISLDLPIVGKPITFGDLAFINQHVPTVRRVLGGFIWLITIVYIYRKITGRGGVMEK